MTDVAGYQLGRVLGVGAFGETYEATKGNRRVALKLIKEQAMQMGFDSHRFEREVRALKKALGPHVVKFIEEGTAQVGNEMRYYIALEYLEGQDLAHAFRAASMNFDETRLKRVLVQIVQGLETIHQQNIIHRDLKPENVFLTAQDHVKLLDFGLVKMLDYTTLTVNPGQPIGTPLYIAPEILRAQTVDYRADFYSLGVLIYHLVTNGRYPFMAQTPFELYARVVNDPPMPPTRYNTSLSSEFENLILTLLAKEPYERAFNHSELIHAIQSTPVAVPRTLIQPPLPTPSYVKKCYIHVLHTEKAVVTGFVDNGGTLDGIIYQASFLPRYRNAVSEFCDRSIPLIFDPVTYRLAYASFAQTEGLRNLPYVPDPNSIITPQTFQSLQAIQAYAQGVINWQVSHGCDILWAPFHFGRDLGSAWIDVDIKLIEEAKAYAARVTPNKPVYAGICAGLETYTIADNRVALLNRYSRTRPDGFFFFMDNFNEKTPNPLIVDAYRQLLHLFQRLGKPVFACRVGTVGLGLLASGVDGITNGIASLTSFSENELLVNRMQGYEMEIKYYIPGLLLSLPVKVAQDLLNNNRYRHLRCNCPFCRQGNLQVAAKAHFLNCRTAEVADLNSFTCTADRLKWFRDKTTAAIAECDKIRKDAIIDLKPAAYSHLKVWLQVFGAAGGAV